MDTKAFNFCYNKKTGHIQPARSSSKAGWSGHIFVGAIAANGYTFDDDGQKVPMIFDFSDSWQQTTVQVVPESSDNLFNESNARLRFSHREFGAGKIVRVVAS